MAARVTRSATRMRSTSALLANTPGPDEPAIKSPATLPRRRPKAAASGSPTPKDRVRKASGSVAPPTLPEYVEAPYDPVMIPAVLSFSFDEAKNHLIKSDNRFATIFAGLPCRPYEHLEPVDPFQTLVTSILGQQISWLAAKSIRHRFLRLFDTSLPEKAPLTHEAPIQYTFPSPGRIASLDVAILKTAGLSTRKAEYVLDLAARFADGRLSTKKLANANDEELTEMLTAVRGIGKWTVDMFAMFSLRRPDILPVGDLGVQRGLLHWVLSSHEPDKYPLRLNPRKLPKTDDVDAETQAVKAEAAQTVDTAESSSILPAPTTPRNPGSGSSLPSTEESPSELPAALAPDAPPRTPSRKRIASSSKSKSTSKATTDERSISLVASSPVPLPEGITLETLKSRANGKKVKGGCYLLPSEMESLTKSWGPYRSLGVFYLWALVDDSK